MSRASPSTTHPSNVTPAVNTRPEADLEPVVSLRASRGRPSREREHSSFLRNMASWAAGTARARNV